MEKKFNFKPYGIAIITGILPNFFGYAVADNTVCYDAPTVGFMLSVKFHSLLVTPAEAAQSGQPMQTAYSVHGKVFDRGTIFMADGTIIVGSPTKKSNISGAKLGLHVHSVFGGVSEETAFPLTLNCASSEATPTPSSWTSCFIRSEDGSYSEGSTIIRVNASDSHKCQQFSSAP